MKRNWKRSTRGVHVIYFEMKKGSFYYYFSFFLSLSLSTRQPSSTYECIAGNSLHVDEKVHQSDTREIISLICSFFFFLVNKYREEKRETARKKEKEEKTKKSKNSLNDKTLFYYYYGCYCFFHTFTKTE